MHIHLLFKKEVLVDIIEPEARLSTTSLQTNSDWIVFLGTVHKYMDNVGDYKIPFRYQSDFDAIKNLKIDTSTKNYYIKVSNVSNITISKYLNKYPNISTAYGSEMVFKSANSATLKEPYSDLLTDCIQCLFAYTFGLDEVKEWYNKPNWN